MSTSFEDIVAQVALRQSEDAPLKKHMITIRDRYNGAADGFVLPVPGVEEDPQYDPLIPTLVSEAVDQLAMRAGETLPGVICPPLQHGKASGVRSREYANIRERAIMESWDRSRFNLGLRRMYRHLGGYASMAAAVMPDPDIKMPRVKVMDPLTAYPEPRSPEDLSDSRNCAFVYGKASSWIRAHYPAARSENGGPVGPRNTQWDELWDMVMWCDEEEWVYGLLGPRPSWNNDYSNVSGNGIMEISRTPHQLSKPPFIVASKVTMDKIISQMVNVTGLIDLKARLMSLQLAAAEKAIFPDKYILGDENTAVVVNGGGNQWKDGRNGEINIVQGARAIGNLVGTPDQTGMQLADRFERDFRISTALTPQAGGETYGALRTGRGIDALQGEAVDPKVKEMQEIAEAHLPRLNEAILESLEVQYRGRKIFLFPGQAGDDSVVELEPEKHIEGMYANRTRYAITGAGVEATNIVIAQMVGSGMISRETARAMHPYVRGNYEGAKITAEQLQDGMVNGILQQLATGGMPPIMVAYIEQELQDDPDIDIFEALRRADEKMRQLQAQEPAPEAPPEQQPGIQPGAPAGPTGVPPEVAGVIGPTSGVEGLRELNNALASSNRVVGA